jgi:hypothetical protein
MSLMNLIYRLFEFRELAKNPQFLRLVAIAVRHAYFDAKKDRGMHPLLQWITLPMADFMENQVSLLEAADRFSHQEPKYSDLSELLLEISRFGPLFIQLPLSSVGLEEPDLAASSNLDRS